MADQIALDNPVADHPLNRGLVSWWKPLPNNSGGQTLFDLVPTGRNHGTLTNGPTWGAGTGGAAVVLANASTNMVDTGVTSNAVFNNASGAPLCGFFVGTPTTVTPGSVAPLFSKRHTTAGWALYMLTSGALRLVQEKADGATGVQLDSSTGVLAAGRRSSVGFVMDCDGTAQIYVDGLLVASSSPTAYTPWNAADALQLGGEAASTRAWPGSVESWSLWRGRTLSASDFAFLDVQAKTNCPDLLRRVPTATWISLATSPPPPPATSSFVPAFAAGWGW